MNDVYEAMRNNQIGQFIGWDKAYRMMPAVSRGMWDLLEAIATVLFCFVCLPSNNRPGQMLFFSFYRSG